MENYDDKQTIRRYLNGTYSSKEAKHLAEKLNQTDNQDLLEELATEVWEESELQPQASDLRREQYRQEAATLIKKLEPRKHRPIKNWLIAATSIAAAILIYWGGLSLKHQWEVKHVILTQVETSYGEKKEITLPDGSLIVLNACSKLQYPDCFITHQRKVTLSGEAYFKITPNPQKPFRVETPKFQVEVLGTTFNVKSYADDDIQSVEVETGKVEIELPEDRIRLKKQEQIYIHQPTGEYSKRIGKNHKVAGWRKGTLHFDQTPLTDVARELERRYHRQIIFRNGENYENLISGEHDNQSLTSFLESLHYVCGINYEEKEGKIILYK